MYRILLADDEGIVLNSLEFIIEKNFKGQYELEKAKTGRSAIEQAEHFRPDLIFMDIQMPGINGIEAMREIKDSLPGVIFVVLTAYDKFDYAKESINLGVMEYLNKPVNQKVVVEVINRAIKKIDSKREKRNQDLWIKERLETVVPIIENGFIYSLLFQEHFEEDIENYKNLLNITSAYGFMLAVVFGDVQEGNYMTNAVGSSVKAQMDYYPKVREILKEAFPDAIIGNVSANKIPVFMPTKVQHMEYEERIDLIEKARETVRNMKKNTGISYRIGFGRIRKLRDAIESYEEGLKSLYSTKNSVAHVDDLPLTVEYEESYPVDTEDSLFEKLKDGKSEGCLEEARKFFDWMINTYGDDPMSIKLKTVEFVLRAEFTMYREGGRMYRFESRKNYLPEVYNMDNYEDLRKWFLNKVKEASMNVSSNTEEHANQLIAKAQTYIDTHFHRDISLDDISKELNISPYYFSKLFKEETGENFVEYVTERRIKRGKDLLKDPDRSIKEICTMVGYSDPNYFSRIFKKFEGITPTEYRDQTGHR